MSDTTSPARASKRFAFLVHPRADVATDMGRVWRPLGHIPSAAWDWAAPLAAAVAASACQAASLALAWARVVAMSVMKRLPAGAGTAGPVC